MPINSHFRFALFPLLLLFLGAPGCGSHANSLDSPTAQRLRSLAEIYLDYAAAKGAGPADPRELRKHLQSVPDFMLTAIGLTKASHEKLFVSDRDQEPFIVNYGVSVHCSARSQAPVIACEKKGQNGARLAVFADGKVNYLKD